MVILVQHVLLVALLLAPSGQDDAYKLYKEARRHWYRDDWAKAAEVYRDLIKQYPRHPLRFKSQNSLGYCLYSLNEKEEAFDLFSGLIEHPECKEDIKVDAKSKRLQIAYDLAESDPGMISVLKDALKDDNFDIRLSAAIFLSKLGDKGGLEVLFSIVEKESDVDMRDMAAKYIIQIGGEKDKERLTALIAEREENSEKRAQMLKLVVRDLDTNDSSMRINVPIGLVSILLRSLSEEQIQLVKEQQGIDLRNLDFSLEDLPSGHVLFQVIDKKEGKEIKLYLE